MLSRLSCACKHCNEDLVPVGGSMDRMQKSCKVHLPPPSTSLETGSPQHFATFRQCQGEYPMLGGKVGPFAARAAWSD